MVHVDRSALHSRDQNGAGILHSSVAHEQQPATHCTLACYQVNSSLCAPRTDGAPAQPLELELMPDKLAAAPGGSASWIHTKALYRLTAASRDLVRGCSDEMCSTSVLPSGVNLWGP